MGLQFPFGLIQHLLVLLLQSILLLPDLTTQLLQLIVQILVGEMTILSLKSGNLWLWLYCKYPPAVLHLGLCLLSSSAVAGPPGLPPVGPLIAASQPTLAPSFPGHAVISVLQVPWHGDPPGVEPALSALPLEHFGVPLLPGGDMQQVFTFMNTLHSN